MMGTMFIAVLIVLIVMTYLLFLVIARSVDKLNEIVKHSFLKNLEIYDCYIEEKSEKLNLLNQQLANQIEEETMPVMVQHENDAILVDFQADYINTDFNSDYVLVRETFKDLAYKAMVNQVNELIRDRKNVNVHELKEIQTLFTYDIYYEMLLLDSEEQVEVMNAVVQHSAGKKRILRKYIEQVGKFDFKEFMDYVQDYIFNHDTLIYVYSYDGHHAIENSPKHVLYRADQTITEGYKVKYKDKVYDFSL